MRPRPALHGDKDPIASIPGGVPLQIGRTGDPMDVLRHGTYAADSAFRVDNKTTDRAHRCPWGSPSFCDSPLAYRLASNKTRNPAAGGQTPSRQTCGDYRARRATCFYCSLEWSKAANVLSRPARSPSGPQSAHSCFGELWAVPSVEPVQSGVRKAIAPEWANPT